MATPFRLKRSAVANKRPGLTDLQLGELALNTYDGRLFAERDTGGVGIGTTIALLTPFTENYGGGSIYYNDGSVGIGTTNPTGKFEVFGGRIVGAATSNVIPFLYSNYSDLPSASTYHGAFAHVHSVGKGFFAHAGNWIEIVSKETNGTVGSGTERYNIGPTDLTTLDVSGISTFAEQVSVGSSINVTGVVTASSFVGPLTGTATGLTGTPNIEVGIVTASSFVGTGVSVVGVVTATSYVGSGVALSGIVTSLVAGSNITLSGSSGQVTISSSGVSPSGGTGGKFVENNTGIHTLSNVGIGTTNASDDLTVRGDIAFTGRLKVTDLGLAGSNGQYLKSVGSGVTWASFPDARTSQTFTATDGQTTFTFTYNVNFIDVYVNGVKLATSEFTATNGTSVVLDEACFAGDIVEVISFNTTATGGGGSGGITDVVQDATPQLGGNLDLNSNSITGTGNVSISGIVTATSFVGGLTGNSSSATQLQTSRNIGGVAFNGTSDINLPGVNQTGTQSINTSGIVTASSLVGTGVSVVGVVTATSFVGSGANLTGVLTPTGNGIGLSGIVTSIIAGTNVTISGATGAVTINASGGGGGSIAGISTTGTSHFANLQLTGITTGLNVSGVSTFQSHVHLGNDDELRLGAATGGDMVIVHDGDHGTIDNNDGNLNIKSEGNISLNPNNTNDGLNVINQGAVELFYNNSKKFETTNTGAVATGILTATTFSGSGASLTTLNASELDSGTIPDARFPATLPAISGANLTNLPSDTPADTDVQVTYDVSSNGSSAYRFTGPGYSGADDNPDLYLVRGQRYRFINGTGSSHPFRIQSNTSGTAYTDGVSGSQSGTQDFNVQYDAPTRLYYQCTIHSGMIGNIYIVGGSDWRMTDVATSAIPEIFTNLNVGIGTDNPSLTSSAGGLHIAGGNAALKLQNTSNGDWAFVEYADETNTTKYIQGYRDGNGAYGIRPGTSLNADPGITVTSDSKIGINNQTPLYPMHFKNAMASTPSYIHMEVTGTNTVGGGAGIQFDTSASNAQSNNGLYLAQISGERSSSNDGSNSLVFKTTKAATFGDDGNTHSPKTRMTIDENGNVNISDGNLVVASGHGIDFSATANGGTGTPSELLDDYEEGFFTPTIYAGADNGSGGAPAFAIQAGRYVKIGRKVHCDIYIRFANGDLSTGVHARIGNLPFAIANESYGNVGASNLTRGGGVSTFHNTTNDITTCYGTNNTGVFYLYKDGGTSFIFGGSNNASLNGLYWIGIFEYICTP